MSKLLGLKCKECGATYPVEPRHYCDECFGPVEIDYDYDAARRALTWDSIQAGPLSLWRYRALLPVEDDAEPVTLQEGFTPLLPARNLGRALGLDHLYIKNDAVNPTYSFKDRVVSVAATAARSFGFKSIACPSTGNLACAVAAYGAVAGMRAFVFIPEDLEQGKIVGAGVYQPCLIRVRGTYDDVNRLCSEVAERLSWAFVNINIRPFYAEGSKTLGFEVAEQLGRRAPDHVVVPMASGSLLTKIHKGFQEFIRLGLIDDRPTRMSGAQAHGCSPIVDAFKSGSDVIVPVKPDTIARSLAIGNPADGYYAWKVMNETGGAAESATDEEIVDAITLLARTEGVFAETAGGVTVAVLKKLAEQGVIRRDEVTVAYITGNGLKTQEAVLDRIPTVDAIAPTSEGFDEAYIEYWLQNQAEKIQATRRNGRPVVLARWAD